jgi:integrase-like protein
MAESEPVRISCSPAGTEPDTWDTRLLADEAVAGGGAGNEYLRDLRHYYASMLIASRANVKVVQARLGHASAKTTLDTYSHLWRTPTTAHEPPSTARWRLVWNICGLRRPENCSETGQRLRNP